MKKTLLCFIFGWAGSLNAQIIEFPDPNLKKALVSSPCVNTFGVNVPYVDADTNNDGEIDMTEAAAVTELHLDSRQISSLDGLEHFTNLESLDCGNNQLTSINVQGLANLYSLYCYNNQLKNLDLGAMTNLVYLNCGQNQLSELNIQGLTNLITLWCSDNQLTALNLGEFKNLDRIYCNNNLLTSLDLTGLDKLERLDCSLNKLYSLQVEGLSNLKELQCAHNQLSELELEGLTKLEYLYCNDNKLTKLDLATSANLLGLVANNNQLEKLNVSNGNEEFVIGIAGNPGLTCICCDERDYLKLENNLLQYGYANTSITFNCGDSNCPAAQPNNDILIYPNPTNYSISITSTKTIEKIVVRDLEGNVRPQLPNDVFANNYLFVGHLENGAYILEYFIEGKAYYANFIKQ